MLNSKDELAVLKQVGSKLREARELLGTEMTLKRAAVLLGTSKQILEALEAGRVNNCPVRLIKKASEVYDVSCDYLFGFTSDFECDPAIQFERQMGLGLHNAYMYELAKFIVDHQKQQVRQDALSSVVREMLTAASDIAETVERFQKLNNRFEEMPCGSQLIHRTRVLRKLASEARNRLKNVRSSRLRHRYKVMINFKEFQEAERMIREIDDDQLHPANDRNNLNHNQVASALKQLKSKGRC